MVLGVEGGATMNAQVVTNMIQQEAKVWIANVKSSPRICLLLGLLFFITLAVPPLFFWLYGINAEPADGSWAFFEALVKTLRKLGIVAAVVFLTTLRLGLFKADK